MLIVQPTSTCDVCLERYAWDSPASSADTEHLQRPHVITCGHVFCHQCLQNLRTPRTCPLCRASFHLTRAVRIHVDLASPNSPTPSTAILSPDTRPRVLSTEETEARRLELRLAEAFSDAPSTTTSVGVATSTTASGSRVTTEAGDGESEGDNRDHDAEENIEERRNSIVEEARAWLDNMSPNSYPILRALLRTLPSHSVLTKDIESAQAETARLRSEREHLKRHIRRAEKAREQEAALSRSAEKGWLVRVAEVERDCELKLTQAETERCRMEEELMRLRTALKESQAAQSDVLVQAHMQINTDQDREHKSQQQLASQSSSTSLRVVHAPAPPYSPRQQERAEKAEVGPSASGSSSIAFPRTSSPTPMPVPRPSSPLYSQVRDPDHSHSHSRSRSIKNRDRDRERDRDGDYYDYTPSHNPLPRPPEPIPLSRLPAFARPKPGSSAYSAAKALARHGSASLRRGERGDRERDRDRSERKREKGKERGRETRTDSEKDRRERRREKEREREWREGERKRDRDRNQEDATTDSGRGRRHGKDKDPYRDKEKGKERERGTDRGTDTSTTETQERARRRERTRHASLVGTPGPSSFSSSAYAGVGASSTGDKPIDILDKGHGRDRDAELDGSAPIPVIPRDVVGGWGLERSWRASMASSGHSGGEGASRDDLRTGERELENGNVGSSYTKLGFRDDKEKGKGKEKEREGDRREDARREEREEDEGEEGEEDVREDFVFVRSSREHERFHDGHDHDAEQTRHVTRERERHVSFSTYPYDARDRVRDKEKERDASHELPRLPAPTSSYNHPYPLYPNQSQPQSQGRDRERERRTTLSAAPSALGLVLVPSPDGRGGYTYAYQYQQAYLAPQSTIQTASQAGSSMGNASAQGYASGKESVTPLASQFFRGTTAVHANAAPSASYGTEYATTLSRRATDTALSSLARARTYTGSAQYMTSQQAQARAPSSSNNLATTTAAAPAPPLHVPQPRRISQTIPEPPESDTSPRTFGLPQVQPHSRSFHTRDQGHGQSQQPFPANGANAGLNQAYYAHPSSNKSGHGTGQEGAPFYANVNPSANMSLDSALASLGNSSSAPVPPYVQTTSVAPGAGTAQAIGSVHTLRHQTSNSSTASASTGISLTGSTSRERRKQLLDALFSDSSDPANAGSGSNRSSFTSENAHPHGGGNSKEEGGGKRTVLGRVPDTGAAAGVASGVSGATDPDADARRDTASGTTNNPTSTGLSGGVNQAQPEAPRGVPSRDGRPSRGLSTRPASTQPQTQASQIAPGAPTVYYTHHVPATTTSYSRPVTYAQANVPPGTYPTTTAQHPTYVYHVTRPSATATAAGYASYAGYYQQQPRSQPHTHNRSQTYTLPRPQAYSLPHSQLRSYVDTHAQNQGATATGTAASGTAVPSNWTDRRQY